MGQGGEAAQARQVEGLVTVGHYQSVALALDAHRLLCELRKAHFVCAACRYLERLDDEEDERASLPFRGSSYAGLCDDAIEEQARHVVDLTAVAP